MKIQCQVCESAEANVMCCADEAALCWSCDQKVHAANKLANKHQRVPLSTSSSSSTPKCDICQGCETVEAESMRQHFPFYTEMQTIFAARMQRMLWIEAEGAGSASHNKRQLSSDDDEEDNDASDAEIKIASKKKAKKGNSKGILNYPEPYLEPERITTQRVSQPGWWLGFCLKNDLTTTMSTPIIPLFCNLICIVDAEIQFF